MISPLRNLLADNSGATLMEYAIIVSLIAVVCVLVIKTLGTGASTLLNSGATSI